MSNFLRITAGRVIDPSRQFDAVADVFVAHGKIVESLSDERLAKAELIDAKGLVVCPGFVDLHCHLREPGDTHKETIASGTRAAAAGGYTTLVCMPNTKPPADNPGTIRLISHAIDTAAVVNVLPTGCLTVGREGEQLAPIGSLKAAGVVAVSDGGHCIQNSEIMRRAIEYAAMFDLVVLDHCEDANMTEGCVMNEGEWALRLGLRGMPRAAEDVMIARDIIFASHYGARIHLQHISSAYSVDTIRRAKQRGIPVTAEVTPYHLSLTEAALHDYDTRCKVVPPLRTEADRLALIEGLLDGTIDCISSAHAPHSEIEKDREFDYAPFGINTFETAFSIAYEALVLGGHTDLPKLIDLFTRKPAQILKLDKGTLQPGAKADITLLAPDARWTPTADKLYSLSHNTPWLGKVLPAEVRATFVNGRCVFNGRKPAPAAPPIA